MSLVWKGYIHAPFGKFDPYSKVGINMHKASDKIEKSLLNYSNLYWGPVFTWSQYIYMKNTKIW